MACENKYVFSLGENRGDFIVPASGVAIPIAGWLLSRGFQRTFKIVLHCQPCTRRRTVSLAAPR